MSSILELELLMAKVNPSYRLDLLKHKPQNAKEFETACTDLENTYLVFDAIEQNTRTISPRLPLRTHVRFPSTTRPG